MQFTEMLIPMVAAFAITVILMPLFIGYMRMKKEGQTIREVGPKWHEKKNGTPTMGGVVFIFAIFVAAIVTGWWQHQLTLSVWAGLFILVLYGALGFWDDFISVSLHRNMGLRARQKLLGQIIGGGVFLAVYFHEGFPTVLPLFGYQLNAAWLFAAFALVWMVGFSNAVNLSDGLDGLVAGLSTIAFAAYAVLAAHDGRTDVLILCLVTIGGMIGFFLFNHKPAKIFMGDAGSLALGGLIAVIALLLDRPWSLLLIGIVFVCETASVILQVGSFKLFHRRIFKMAPIHHHFELLGWSEWKVDVVFWLVGLIGAAMYLAIALV